MIESILRSLVWLMLILFVGLGATFVVVNEIIRSQLKLDKPVIVRDSIGTGSHTLSGVVPVPSTCDEVLVNPQKTSENSYTLLLTTWRDPYVSSCSTQGGTREFRAFIASSPLNVSFSATLDGTPIPIAVIPEVPLRPPLSTTSTSTIAH